MPTLKEPWYFASDLREGRHTRRRFDTLDAYLSLFKPGRADQRLGEASPVYLVSRTAAANIAAVQPAARVIAILREPTSFLRSYHLQCLRTRTETERDLRRAMELEERRQRGTDLPANTGCALEILYSEHVRYVEQLRRFHAVFPREQVLVLIYDDYRADNGATVRSVLRFLDVDEQLPLEAVEVNPTVNVRSPRLHAIVHAVSAGRTPLARAVKRSGRALTPQRLRGRALDAARRRVIYGEPRPPDPGFMLELRRRFKGEVVALSEYLGRDLVSLWGYDELDR